MSNKVKNKPSLIIQHNVVDTKSNKVIESNTKSEKNKQQKNKDNSNTTPDNIDNNNIEDNNVSTLNKAYRSIGDWLYLSNFNFFCSLLRYGPIPKHIGVIMDGNRRFAKRLHIDSYEGHKLGFTKMLDLCQWGLALGVEIISVYAFSIENFKRPKAEVDYLMELANQKFEEMISKSHKLQKMGVRIKVVGDLSLIPDTTKSILARAVQSTQDNTKALLNICMSYTSHEEMLHSMNTIAQGVNDNLIKTEDIDQGLLEKCMYVEEDLDILVRTSGEYRLSDFMLWQSCFSNTNFLNVLWPDFSSFHFFYVIFLYQINYQSIKEQQRKKILNNNTPEQKERIDKFINQLDEKQVKMFKQFSNIK